MLSVLQDACLLSLASHTPNLGAGCSHEPSWISHSTPLGYFSQTEEAGTDTRVQSSVPKGKAGTDPELLEFIFSAHGLGRAPNVPGIDHHHCNFTSHCSVLGALPVNLPWFCPWISDKPCCPQLRNSLILVSLQESPTHSTKPMLFLLFLWSAHWNVEEVGLAFKGRAEKLFRDKSSRNHSRVVRIGA